MSKCALKTIPHERKLQIDTKRKMITLRNGQTEPGECHRQNRFDAEIHWMAAHGWKMKILFEESWNKSEYQTLITSPLCLHAPIVDKSRMTFDKMDGKIQNVEKFSSFLQFVLTNQCWSMVCDIIIHLGKSKWQNKSHTHQTTSPTNPPKQRPRAAPNRQRRAGAWGVGLVGLFRLGLGLGFWNCCLSREWRSDLCLKKINRLQEFTDYLITYLLPHQP